MRFEDPHGRRRVNFSRQSAHRLPATVYAPCGYSRQPAMSLSLLLASTENNADLSLGVNELVVLAVVPTESFEHDSETAWGRVDKRWRVVHID